MSNEQNSSEQDYRDVVLEAVRDRDTFHQVTLSRPRGGAKWRKISVRPVVVKGRRRLQFSYFGEKQALHKNCDPEEALERLRGLMSGTYRQIHVQTSTRDLHVRLSRKGRPHVTEGKPSRPDRAPETAHDRRKERPLAAGRPDRFLQALGVMTPEGEVRASMQGKFRQINEFLDIVGHTVADADRPGGIVRLADCGCGKAYLTFAAYHYLNDIRSIPTRVVGIDVNEDLIEDVRGLRDELGWDHLEFRVSSIRDFRPEEPPEVVLSLHACDTATDEAIARGVRWSSRVILAAPCCQHELHDRIEARLFRPLLRHGILRQRLADLLTDCFRALALRIMGYSTDVIEFVDPEATAKNLMIRAEAGPEPGHPSFVREYRELKQFWKVTPAIEQLLGEPFQRLVRE